MEILRIENFNFSYPKMSEDAVDKNALTNINLSVQGGEFVLVCGLSGSGKTTLLRQIKPTLAAHGKRSGAIYFKGELHEELDQRRESSEIGFVQQNPENQIVTDKVWHELAFGLESLGMDQQTIRLRVGEIASFFGMEHWFYNNVKELSGGQLQMVNLASILAMQPDLLLLDEPTSQLDPIAAGEFFQAVKKINDELGITVILSEHRLGDVYSLADRVVYLEDGEIVFDGGARDFGKSLVGIDKPIVDSLPIPTQIFTKTNGKGICPITIGEGKRWLGEIGIVEGNENISEKTVQSKYETVISMENISFRYSKDGEDVIKNISMDIPENRITCIMGGNGAGKTTTLKLLAGLESPIRGKIYDYSERRKSKGHLVDGLAMVPQNPKTLFVKKTVGRDLEEMGSGSAEEIRELADKYAELFQLTELLHQHPYDISGGEQQRLAIAKVMMSKPMILFMDEPTKGMDGAFKKVFAGMLYKLIEDGVTILIVSHDLEFCAEVADMCYLFFKGEVISQGSGDSFFKGNHFYTTAANKMFRDIDPNVITVGDAVEYIEEL